jgi:hypothetical protein
LWQAAGNNAAAKGDIMTIANRVIQWERATFAWVEVEDKDSVVYRHDKGITAPGEAIVHVSYAFDPTGTIQSLALVPGGDGRPILRQDQPGLPEKMIVQYLDVSQIRGSPNPQGWEAKYEYNRQ